MIWFWFWFNDIFEGFYSFLRMFFFNALSFSFFFFGGGGLPSWLKRTAVTSTVPGLPFFLKCFFNG